MELLDKLVLPQSAEHIALLHYLTLLVLFLFIPYFSILLGGTALSLFYRRKYRLTGDTTWLQFARVYIEDCTINKTSGVMLGILPVLGLLLMFAQLMHTTGAGTVPFLMAGLIAFAVGTGFVFTYRYSFFYRQLFDSLGTNAEGPEIDNEKAKLQALSQSSGFWGLLVLLPASYFIIAGITITMFPADWKKSSAVIYLFTSGVVFAKWLYFLVGSFAFAASFVLFTRFFWEGGKSTGNAELDTLLKKKASVTALISSLILPLLVMVNVISVPAESLSTAVFAFAIIGLLMLLFLYHFAYEVIKNGTSQSAGWVFVFLLLAVLSFIVSDHSSVNYATRTHSAILAKQYDAFILEKYGDKNAVVEVSGEEIFKVKCQSCHAFDKKLVGPPYNESVPGYKGDVDLLAGYIMNPVKKRPDYPIMPNQGLKPNEAKAVAKYLIDKVK